jgi:hypothetical protein
MKENGLTDSIPTPKFIPWELGKLSNKVVEIAMERGNGEELLREELFVFDDVLEKVSNELSFHEESFQKVQVNFFFSLRDIYFLFSEKFLETMFTNKFSYSKNSYITSKNAVFGKFTTSSQKEVTLHDYSGISSPFTNLLLLLAIPHPLKNTLRKDFMEKELVENFQTFLDYAIHDVLALSMCNEKLKQKISYIKHSILAIPKSLQPSWADRHLPSTVGRLVSNMFGDYVENFFRVEGSKNGNDNLLNRFRLLNKKLALIPSNLTELKKIKALNNDERIISDLCLGSSVDSYYHLYRSNTGIFNALTSGGRCRNEQSDEYSVQNAIADIDLAGCYGSSLNVFSFPLGLSTVIAFTANDKPMTLKAFFNKYEDQLVENLYQIVVSGTLSFPQSLLYSKLITRDKLAKRLDKHLLEDSDLSGAGDFTLMTHEVENCILTSDLLEILQKVSSNLEYNEILNFKVVTASMYQKKDYVENLDEFLQKIEESPGEYTFNKDTQGNWDTRTRIWTKIPLSGFIDPLMKERAKLKVQIKDLKEKSWEDGLPKEVQEKSSEKLSNLQSNEKFIKLLINTLYGVICSRYFRWSNTIVANNITARARGEIWMIRAALGGKQSITDGCQYCLNEVNVVKNEKGTKPGLKTLSDQRNLSNHRNISVQPLGGRNWTSLFESSNTFELETTLKKLDSLAFTHLENFFAHYHMKMKYKIEHKLEHTSRKMFYVKQAHYSLRNSSKTSIFPDKNRISFLWTCVL